MAKTAKNFWQSGHPHTYLYRKINTFEILRFSVLIFIHENVWDKPVTFSFSSLSMTWKYLRTLYVALRLIYIKFLYSKLYLANDRFYALSYLPAFSFFLSWRFGTKTIIRKLLLRLVIFVDRSRSNSIASSFLEPKNAHMVYWKLKIFCFSSLLYFYFWSQLFHVLQFVFFYLCFQPPMNSGRHFYVQG